MPAQTMWFVSGLPRTGSTWVAQALAAATGARLVHEPFNWRHYPDRIEYHMRYVAPGTYDPKLFQILLGTVSTRRLWGTRESTVLIKDVHVCLALPYIWEQFRPYTVILMRHPCGMAQSWHRLQLAVNFRLDILLSQPALWDLGLNEFVTHMRSHNDYFFALGAYWGATYYLLRELSKGHSEWQWITHETLCVDSEQRFRRLLAPQGIAIEPQQMLALKRFLQENDRARRTGEGAHSVARQTAREPDKWRSQMSADAIAAVLAGAEPFGMLEWMADVEQGFEEGAAR